MLTPRPHQVEAIETAVRKNILLADECGLGKTLTAIEVTKALRAKIRGPVLIVVTKSIKLQWERALIEQGIDPQEIFTLTSKTKEAKLVAAAEDTKGIVILANYEAVVKHLSMLQNFYYALIVADEAHKIRNRKAQRTTAIKLLKAYRKIAMTGTPWDRNPADVWSILQFLDPAFYTSYWRFFGAHINYAEIRVRGNTTVKKINDREPLADPEGFARVLRSRMLRRYKSEVRADLPERIDQIVPLEMNPDQARVYDALYNSSDILTEIEGVQITAPIILTEILRLIQITTDPSLLELKASSTKLEWLEDWLEENQDKPFVIFSRFKATAEKVYAMLKARGIAAKLIIGGKQREIVTLADRAIVGTIAAMGEGLDLPHIDYAIFLDVEWSSILMQQAVDRIHRINIENVKQCIYLQCKGTIDELVYQAVTDKWSTQELAFNYIGGKNHG